MECTVDIEDLQSIIDIFGYADENIRIIEEAFQVNIRNADNVVKIIGDDDTKCKFAENVIAKMCVLASQGELITKQMTMYLCDLASEGGINHVNEFTADAVCLSAGGKPIKAKTNGQRQYIREIKDKSVVFGIGPAGTGKTYLAVAMAVNAFRKNEVSRIILTRPAVEAGEKLGFLPGDLLSKVDPYLRPLYDALYDIMGIDSYNKNCERGAIEIAPLAFMRGRTLDNAFIILDEAQNTTPEQLKMFLTRIGHGSKAIVTGDITQIDLPQDKTSGLKKIQGILGDIPEIAFVFLTEKDVVRCDLVQKIIKAYQQHENMLMNKNTNRNINIRG